MTTNNPSLDLILRGAGIRPTRQRRVMLGVLRGLGRGHVTADEIFEQSQGSGLRPSFATVYNNLALFAKAGLLKRVDLGEKTWFCTDPKAHHHFLDVTTGRLMDVPEPPAATAEAPPPPPGYDVVGVDVLIRIRPRRPGRPAT